MRHPLVGTRAALLAALALAAAVPLALAGCGAAPGAARTRVRALTFNIRYGSAPDGDNKWTNRQDQVFDLIRRQAPHFVGVQEALPFQSEALREALPDYQHVGRSREADPERGEAVPILYRGDRWDLAASGTFWLSDTPEEPGSKTWGNNLPRIVTWGRFVEKPTGRTLYVFNTHFDHQSQPSREKSAVLLARRIHDVTASADPDAKAAPWIAMGDLNAGESNPAVLHLKGRDGQAPVQLVDTFRARHPDAKDCGTFHEFTGSTAGDKIDYVFAPAGVKVLKAGILRDNREGRYPSDHFPVVADVAF